MLLLVAGCSPELARLVIPEQRELDIRDPAAIVTSPLPNVPPPATVSSPAPKGPDKELSLDEAIRIALQTSTTIRTLVGTDVVASGQTIYDPAIANTTIDVARAPFDPIINAPNTFTHTENPQAFFDLINPGHANIPFSRIDNYELGLGISKKMVTGATLSLDDKFDASRFLPGAAPLNPQLRNGLTLSFNQPLMQGAGVAANIAPILIARINTEKSYFQLKDSVQELVRGVVEAYWAVVFARTDVWTRRQQVEQGQAAYARAEARKKAGFDPEAVVAQAKVALSNFRASLVTAEANLLQREDTLRNIMGLPPTEPMRFVPTTPPTAERFDPKWDAIVSLAEEYRPDLIELSLILEADQQNLIVARNQALPKMDAALLYRWNGLEGTAPNGDTISTTGGQFNDWSVGVSFSVPLGLRQGRANVRSAELVLLADRANLDQGRHHALHILSGNVRNLAQYYEQYKAFSETRTAARINLEQQVAEYRIGRVIFLNVLQAITDWGNAVSSEAQALAQYNTELANLEKQTGTILESHGIRFMEERCRAVGPLGRCAKPRCYPESVFPDQNAPRYPALGGPPEKQLEKDVPTFKDPPGPPKLAPLPQGLPLEYLPAPQIAPVRIGVPSAVAPQRLDGQ